MPITKTGIINYVIDELEGAYSNHSADTGGLTLYGITEVGWKDFQGRDDVEWPPTSFGRSDAFDVYNHIWNKMHIDLLPDDMKCLVFAFGVNAGYGTATRLLQNVLGLNPDGIIGPMTKGGYEVLNHMHHVDVKLAFAEGVNGFYAGRSNYDVFGEGWINRLLKTLCYCEDNQAWKKKTI